MSMKDWAKREIEIACKRERGNKEESEWDYGCACYESALKAYESLMNDGHSGFSISVTKQILIRLIEGKPLTPIEDTDDIWVKLDFGENECISFQCKRMSSLFKKVYNDGTVKYSDVDRIICIDTDNPKVAYTSGLISEIINEMFPITMPYFPNKSIKVYCRSLLTDRKNGDFDTKAILYAVLPDDKKVDIQRYFKEAENGYEEIDKDEYESRVAAHNERELKECDKNG
ncbi:MAG: hypothetical protein ACI4GX_09555 [Ruminococcus sp.]